MKAPAIPTLLALSLLFPLTLCTTFTISNNCPHAIWPGTLAGAGTPQLPATGFLLDPGQTACLPAPPGWSGRIWARTGCAFDGAGAGSCQTGDCGGRMACDGAGALPPATLFEVTLGEGGGDDFYDVSLVDGYNLPVIAAPIASAAAAGGACNATGCMADLNSGCPKELQVVAGGGGVVACRSACGAFGGDEYCCSGEFASPGTCRPSSFSAIFKAACPRAYSYAFDDGTSTFTCKANDYVIIFCPTVDGLRRSNDFSVGQPTHGDRDRDGPSGQSTNGDRDRDAPSGRSNGDRDRDVPSGRSNGDRDRDEPSGQSTNGDRDRDEPSGQSTDGDRDRDEPQAITSSGSFVSSNFCFLLLFIFFF